MIISCESCSTRFKVPDARVTEKGTKVRCSKCTHVFVVFPEGTPTKPETKKKTLQFRAGALDEAGASQDEKFKKRVTETFDMPPASSSPRVSPFQSGSQPPIPTSPPPKSADPFASASLPATAADPFSSPSSAAPGSSSPSSTPPVPAASKATAPLIPPGADPFGSAPSSPPPSSPSPSSAPPSSSPFGASDPFSMGGQPPQAALSSDPFSSATAPPTSPAGDAKADLFGDPKGDPFGQSQPPAAAGADPFGAVQPATPPGPSSSPAADPFGGAPDPFAAVSLPPTAAPTMSPPTTPPVGQGADPFAMGATPAGGGSGPPTPPPMPTEGASPFGPPINFGGEDAGGPENDPIQRPPVAAADPFASAPGPNRANESASTKSPLDGLFDDAVATPGPPPVPMGAKPITDPFDGTAAEGPDIPEHSGALSDDAMADEAGAFDGDLDNLSGDEPPRQNFQAETKIYSVPHELREASMPGRESPQPATTMSIPIPPSIWRTRAALVASTAWQIAVLALFMFAALVWARGGSVDDVLEGRALSVITRGTVNVSESSSVSVSNVRVSERPLSTSDASNPTDPARLVIVTGDVQNLTESPIRGVAVKVTFDHSTTTGPFYGWAGEGIDPIDVSLAASDSTIAEIAAQPIVTTIAPGATAPFAVLAPRVPMGAVARVSAKPQSVALPLPNATASAVTIPIELDAASASPKASKSKRGRAAKRPRP